MKKIIALVMAAMMLLVCCSALAEAPEGYPEINKDINMEGKDIYIYIYINIFGIKLHVSKIHPFI